MMRILTAILPLFLFLVLGFLVAVAPSDAFAQNCCGCCNCWMKYYTDPPCDCPGENGCGTCSYCKSDSAQLLSLTSQYMADTTPIPMGPMSTIAKIDLTDQVVDLMRAEKCFRAKVALSLLGDARERFVPLRFNDKNSGAKAGIQDGDELQK